jgi:hypothetical protein
MWDGLRQLLLRLWRLGQQRSKERRVIEERERFWSEVREGEREGEREAEAESVP